MFYLDYILIMLYLAAIAVTTATSKFKCTNLNDYFIFGRKLSSTNLALLWALAWVGGASTMGLISNTYYYGLSAYWWIIGVIIGYLIFAFLLAPRVRQVGDKLNQLTLADIIEDRYDHRCRIIVTLINILTFILYTASQIVAISYILNFTGLLSAYASVLLGSLLFSVYTAKGGLAYISRLAYLQAVLIVSGVFIVLIYGFGFLEVTRVFASVPIFYWNFSQSPWGVDNVLVILVSTICSVLISSDGYMRCLAAKDENNSKRGLLGASALTVIMTLGFLIIGLYSQFLLPDLSPVTTGEIITLLWGSFHPGIKGLFIIALLAVILSTADISMLVATASITKDVYYRFICSSASQKSLLKVSYLSSFLVVSIAALIALAVNDVFAIVIWAFKISTVTLTFPVVGAYFWPKGRASGAFYSIFASLAVTLFWRFLGFAKMTGVNELWLGLAVSFFVYAIASLFTAENEESYRKSQAYCQVGVQKEMSNYEHQGITKKFV